ncbi:phage tail assembly chaperone [Acidovorax sp. NCPPB 4044]|uniref:phage tail assembly chaperone n=1 Tax=Acidovorax sp. NCPPB 4044 TaxID=2940490 RepID=UPI00230394B8|nr:phage tail assembly chaperone [Acidovorax sp. NCPPB 4044]MDA8521978.1 phage tail assembly chaperone [Acidovorax sp. NCPPB 4044]
MATKEKTVSVTNLKSLGEGQAPTFKLPIVLTKLDGKKVRLTFTCKALRKTEWAALRDERQRAVFESLKESQATSQGDRDPETGEEDAETPETAEAASYLDTAIANIATHGMEASIRDAMAKDAALVLQFATAWSLTDELSADNLADLEQKFGGSLAKVCADYDRAIVQGRLGNSD